MLVELEQYVWSEKRSTWLVVVVECSGEGKGGARSELIYLCS
jgi:hypothetical protein